MKIHLKWISLIGLFTFFLLGCHSNFSLSSIKWPSFKKEQRELPYQIRPIKAYLVKQFHHTDTVVLEEKDKLYLIFSDDTVFTKNSATLNRALKRDLDRLIHGLQRYPHSSIVIQGFTSRSGEIGTNQALSERRAHQAMAYLEARGISAIRMVAMGGGETQEPLLMHENKRDEAAFRRIQIIFMPIHFSRDGYYRPYPFGGAESFFAKYDREH